MVRIIVAISVAVLASLASTARADRSTTRPTLTVAVVPFDVQGESGQDWLGRAMQQGLATGLQNATGLSAVIVAGIAPADSAGAMAMAKSTAANAVIFGAVQVVDGQIRVVGQIISMSTGKSLGALRIDGAQRDLFKLEDVLADRAQRILTPARPPGGAGPANPPPQIELSGPTIARGGSRYFDGDLFGQITPPPRFRDDYDRYYYYSTDTSYGGAYWAWPCGVCGFGYCNPILCPPAYPVGGW